LTDGLPTTCGLQRFAKTGSWHNHTTLNGAKQRARTTAGPAKD
jgi:hypothetical protein